MPGRIPRPTELGRVPHVGLLALQGDFERHQRAFELAGARTTLVRTAEELDSVDALAIPGGEATTLLRLLQVTGLRSPLEKFARSQPVLGTCAGLILLAGELTDGGKVPFPPLGLLDVEVERNAYGRQLDSFESPVQFDALGGEAFEGVFIRAPRIRRIGEGVEVVVRHRGEPVGVRQGNLLGLTFHPELTDDPRIHRHFLAEYCGSPID